MCDFYCSFYFILGTINRQFKVLTLSVVAFFLPVLLYAQLSPLSNGSWQNPAIWPNSQLPSAADTVVIPAGLNIGLTGNIAVKTLTINGSLKAVLGASIQLQAEWIMVAGNNALFEIGTSTVPFDSSCTITMVGTDDGDDIMGMGDKFIGAMNGAQVELHGQPKLSWTKLGATVSAGTNLITLATTVDWTVGDEIVIVSSNPDWEQAEQRTVTAVSADSLTITLNSPLSYPHFSLVNSYTRSTDNKTWSADLRAEIGLLTHNLKIEGDTYSLVNGFGGHMMCLFNSRMNASSIELHRMGQKGKLGRYPWHWHHVHLSGAGQYFKNSSVHQSFNRGITIHGTSYVNVEHNFFYDHIGHGVFLEDGSERFNTIKDNVVLLSKRPLQGEQVTPSDNQLNEVQNRTPASFWITNPNNYFEGNVAAGTQGTGFWFALPKSPIGSSAAMLIYAGIEPYREPLGLFRNNKAHSCMSGFDIFDQLDSSHSIRKNAGWQDSSLHLIEACTWYSNNLAIYSGIGGNVGNKITYTSNLVFFDNIFVENLTNIQLASYSQIQQSVIVALGLLPTSSLYRIYDGAGQLRNCHLVGWNASNVDYLKDGGAATKHTNHRLSGITTDDGLPPAVKLRDYDIPVITNDTTPQSLSHPRVWNVVLYDEDGSFSGVAHSSVVSNHPFLLVGDEFQPSNWINAYRSSHKFALNILKFPGLQSVDFPNVTCTRTKVGTPSECVYYVYGYKEQVQLPCIVNEGFLYNYQFESLPSSQSLTTILDDAEIGDTCLIRFNNFGKLGGLSVASSGTNLIQTNSITDLNNSTQTAFFVIPNGDLYVKIVATQFLELFSMNWTSDFTVPIVDTDGDLVADRQEIENGTDPCHSNVLSIPKTANKRGIIYPNPAPKDANVVIELLEYEQNELLLSVFDLWGRLIHRQSCSSGQTLSVSTNKLYRGLFVVQIESKLQRQRFKLRIE